MNTKTIGERTESMVLVALLRTDVSVLLPWGDNQRYDLVFEADGRFSRVQCKTGQLIDGCVKFPTRSTYAHRGRPARGYRGEIDYFGVYCPQNGAVYLVPIGDVRGDRQMNLRIEAPKDGREGKINWAKIYELSDAASAALPD